MNTGKSKFVIIPLVLFFIVSPLFAQNEVSAVWSRLYDRASTLNQKQQILMNIVEQHSRDMIPVLQEALIERIDDLRNPKSTTERELATEMAKMVVKELGRLKASETSRYVWEVIQSVEDPFLKGEAILALGKMGAREYAEELAMMLRNINFNYDKIENQRKNEIIAYSLVLALERMKHPAGYKPLFFASTGWYSGESRVKEEAEEALTVVVEDPTDQLSEIIVDESGFEIKTQALEAGLESNAPESQKAAVASLAFKESIRNFPRNKTERMQAKELRIRSLTAIRNLPEKDRSVLPLMEEMLLGYRKDRIYDEDEMLNVLNTLGSFSSDQAARIVSDFLAYLTERREFRATESLRIAKAAVIALGNIGSPVGIEELMIITTTNFWDNSVIRLAEEALQKLQ